MLANYIITALGTSVFWYILSYFKLLKSNMHYADLLRVNSELEFKLKDLTFKYNILKLTSDISAQRPLTPLEAAYKLLGLESRASAQEIKNRYRMLVKKYHPDQNKTAEAITKFKSINDAYNLIKNNTNMQ